MKKILIMNMSAIAVSISALFSVSAIANTTVETPTTAIPSSATVVNSTTSDVKSEKVVGSEVKTEKVENKKEEPKYQVSKSTLYNQLAYDFNKKGYKTVWGLSFDPSFTPKKYNSIEEEMLAASNRLNQVWNGNYDDGNKVLALKCPLKKEIHFVFSNYAASVVDANGVSCDLITPISNDSSNGADGSIQANPNSAAGNNYYETGNVLSGPMIVSGGSQ